MKKIALILIIAITGTIAAYSQNDIQANQEDKVVYSSNRDYARHRLFVYGSTGYSNSIYDKIDRSFIYNHYSFSSALELKYAFFFAPKWGVSLGAGISRFEAKGTLNIEGVFPRYNDPGFYSSGQRYYDLHYKTNDLVEKQEIYALEAPLQFHFENSFGRYGIFASLGAKGYFPIISAKSKFPQGTITTKGYEEFTNAWYTDPPHFGERETRSTPANVKLNKCSVDAIADFGGTFRLNYKCDLYFGAYGSYGFMDVLPKNANKKNFITPEQNDNFVVNSLLASNFLSEYNKYVKKNNLGWKTADEKWNRWQVGLKVGFHFKFGGKKLEKVKENIVVVRDTINIINIINMPPIVLSEGRNFTSSEQENVGKLTELLKNGRILFDLDSFVPKVENMNFIFEAAEILKKEPALRLIVEGYTCELGSEKHNRELATKRANAIRDLFVKQGVASERIHAAAYTANDPQNKLNIIDKDLTAHRVVIFRIVRGN